MARKQTAPAFFDHYHPFTEALENYCEKAGLLLVAAESLVQIAQDLKTEMPPSLTTRLERAIQEYKEAAHGVPDQRAMKA